MPVLLMAAWLLFNGRVTLELVLTGLALTAVICLASHVLLGYRLRRELRLWRRLPRLIAYLLLLLREVFVANLQVIRLILRPDIQGHTKHRLLRMAAPVKSRTGLLLLANSITLTPGTITVSTPEGQICVHALDETFAYGVYQSAFVQPIRAMEEMDDG